MLLRVLFVLLCVCPLARAAERPVHSRELIVCGREEVFILDLDRRDASGTPEKIWSWTAAGRDDLPPAYHGLFRSTDDCKPVDHETKILISSSSGAIALVDRATKGVLFYARVVNAHSVEWLPNNRIAAAASHDPRTTAGDALILFDANQPEKELWRDELPSGHGVVWDAKRERVWALSGRDLRVYEFAEWSSSKPRLSRVATLPLPETGGHDLYPVPHTAFLSVTTSDHCWLFDRDAKTFQPHPQLGDRAHIKSITQHPRTGQIAFTEAEAPNWWTHTIQFLHPSETCSVPGKEFYKVRWATDPTTVDSPR